VNPRDPSVHPREDVRAILSAGRSLDSNRTRTTVITDGGCAEGVGDSWWRGRAGVRHRTARGHPVLRQLRPELHPACDRVLCLPGSLRQPLLSGSRGQRQRQRHNERRPDKLPLGGAQQRGDIQ